MDTILVSAGRSCVAATSDSFTLQILHDECKHHWFTITDKHCVGHSVSVLCSLQQLPSNGAIQILSKFIRIPGKSMTVNVFNTPKQKGPAACGLFAIAFAESIVDGFDPCNILYDESKMRGHLMNCFLRGVMSSFPEVAYRSVRRQIVRTMQYPLYCLCRSTYSSGDLMIQCNKCSTWFHPNCLAMHDSTFDRYCEPQKAYFCPDCVPDIHNGDIVGCATKSPLPSVTQLSPKPAATDNSCNIDNCAVDKTGKSSPGDHCRFHQVHADPYRPNSETHNMKCHTKISTDFVITQQDTIDHVAYQSCGMINLGNTCFLNSAVQLLKCLSDVRCVIGRHKSMHGSPTCVSCALESAFNGEPTSLYQLVSDNCQYTYGAQQDVQEFMVHLLHAISIESDCVHQLWIGSQLNRRKSFLVC